MSADKTGVESGSVVDIKIESIQEEAHDSKPTREELP